MSRILVKDEKTGDILTNSKLTIELVAYENKSGFKSYIDGINTSYDTNKISLPGISKDVSSFNAMLIFKISTESNYYTYYTILVITPAKNVGSDIASSNNLDVIVRRDDVDTQFTDTDTTDLKPMAVGSTYLDLLGTYSYNFRFP